MELTKVELIIISAKTLENNNNKMYDPTVDGSIFSTKEEIKVNKTSKGFSVLYTDEEIHKMDTVIFTSELLSLLMNNIPNGFSITVKYYFTDKDDLNSISAVALIPIMKINDIIESMPSELIHNNEKYTVQYIRDITISIIKQAWYDDPFDMDTGEFINSPGTPRMDVDDDFDVDQSVLTTLSSIIGDIDLPSSKKKKKKSKGKEIYSVSRSRVFKEAKNPKRDVKRHGVIVSRDKDDIKRDRKIIKEFLEEFIPGKQDWLKDFRNELAIRWINMYTIRLKELKKLEKKEKNKAADKKRRKRNKEILNFTRNMFTVPIDSWDDPNK